jgi:molybdopterin molybdotransferase
MISVEEALDLILQTEKDFGTEEVSLIQSAGRILAQDVVADRDFPPYNRVMMDGIAINSAAYRSGTRTFEIEKVQAAGMTKQVLSDVGNCIEVMTGSVVPANTDIVIPYEQCEITEGKVSLKGDDATVMQNVHLQGTDCKKGDLLVERGSRITPARTGIMASVGLASVRVIRFPKITICSTGDELVDVSEQPQPHQVRRSNVYMLAAALLSEGIQAQTVHLPDNHEHMLHEIAFLLTKNDAILFSGAVSKGKFDYLPSVLEQLGMQSLFHTVAQRPGKPFLFGKFSAGPLVFGFPGNPVSTFVCYHQFFKKWLHKCLHVKTSDGPVVLDREVKFKPPLSYHVLVRITNRDGILFASPVTGSGSGDLVTLSQADGLITLPPTRDQFLKGELFELNLLH